MTRYAANILRVSTTLWFMIWNLLKMEKQFSSIQENDSDSSFWVF